jgi:solute carrier family 8 (sodium/calcium exchanger)
MFTDRGLSMSSIVPTAEENVAESKSQDIEHSVLLSVTSEHYAVLESVGTCVVTVDRIGNKDCKASVDYATRDGSATANSDYHPVKGKLEFQPGEVQKSIAIKIIDDTAYEDDEDFYVELMNPSSDSKEVVALIGDNQEARISIVDDDDPGTLYFATDKDSDEMAVTEGREAKKYTITVKRKQGSTGTITCRYNTEDATALKDLDYVPSDGTLTFLPGQLAATIDVKVLPRGRYESKEEFRLILSEPTAGAKFEASRDGGPDTQVLTFCISAPADKKDRVDRIMKVLAVNYDSQKIGHANWRDQFISALMVNGGDEKAEASLMDWVMHIVTVFWKVIFAIIPPADFAGGWLCFVCALLMIGFVTALIGDLASMLGCVVGMSDSTTAITLVALGTSLPDTFASKVAAEQDPYADASVGNVTGSNSVNVFLGLGLPWLIGAVYWHAAGRTQEWREFYSSKPTTSKYFEEWDQGGGKFIVVGDDLKFSVSVFCVCACVGILLLLLRRTFFGGELGGPILIKWASGLFLVFLWLVYVVSSIVYSSQNSVGGC